MVELSGPTRPAFGEGWPERLLPFFRREEPPPATSADTLVDLLLDAGEPHDRRFAAARALAGRVPPERVEALLDCLRTPGHNLRRPLLVLLCAEPGPHTDALRTWLRAAPVGERDRFGIGALHLFARALLADVTAAEGLVDLAAEPWVSWREVGERGLDILVRQCGLSAVLAEFDADSPDALAARGATVPARLFGLRLLHRGGGDVTSVLVDPSPVVARAAYELLATGRGGDGVLAAMVDGQRPGHLWALAVLHRRGHPVRPRWEALGAPRVELPGVPDDVRRAIARQYAPGQPGSDPRWLLELACQPPAPPPAPEPLLSRATTALDAAGLQPRPPVSAAESWGTGSGTYHTIGTAAGTGCSVRSARSSPSRTATTNAWCGRSARSVSGTWTAISPPRGWTV